MSESISVMLVDDHELIRTGLAGVFDLQPDMHVAGQAGSVREALARFAELRPDVVVTDLQLGDGTGLDIVRQVRRDHDDVGLIVLTMHSGDDQIFAASRRERRDVAVPPPASLAVADQDVAQRPAHLAADRPTETSPRRHR